MDHRYRLGASFYRFCGIIRMSECIFVIIINQVHIAVLALDPINDPETFPDFHSRQFQ